MFIIEYFFSIFGDIMGPAPPTNYRVLVPNGIKKLYFDLSSNDSIETQVSVEINGTFVIIGSTPTDNIDVPPHIDGEHNVSSTVRGIKGDWGPPNKPPVKVNFL